MALLLFFCFVLPHAGFAGEEGGTLDQRLRLSAFGTLGATYDSSGSHPGRIRQPDSFHHHFSFLTDSLLGAQADLHIADHLDATVQMVAKDRAEESLDESLEWAFLRWRPLPNLTVRGGRLGLDAYLLSDCRSVGFAYLWERPVVEFYGPLMIDNLDGLDASYSFKLGEGTATAKVFGGATEHSLQLAPGGAPSVVSVSPVFGGRLSYEDERLHLSAGYVNATFANDMGGVGLLAGALGRVPQVVWPDTAWLSPLVSPRNKSMSFYSLGAAYETDNWVFQGEAGYMASRWEGMRDLVSGYLSAGRHFGAVTPYVVLAAAESLGNPPAFSPPAATGDAATDARLSALYAATQLFFKSTVYGQQTLSLGSRWDFHENAALKVQWDLSRVEADGSALWWTRNSVPLATTTLINVLSTSINFAF